MSDSENDHLFGDANITGSSSSIMSSSSAKTEKISEQGAQTPVHLSSIFDIPSPDRFATLTIKVREGVARLEEILQVGPATRPDQEFIAELNEAAQAQPAVLVDLIASRGEASERTAS